MLLVARGLAAFGMVCGMLASAAVADGGNRCPADTPAREPCLSGAPACAVPGFVRGPDSPRPAGCQPFQCPAGRYLDCMPTRVCSKEYVDWVKQNCPGVEVLY